jgi:catechol 2,3-dioxygenase-like lactoylglutathione lyase family enzyme
MAEITGIHHLALTVRDLEKSGAWYEDLFGLTKIMEMEEPPGRPIVLYMHPGSQLMIGLHAHDENDGGDFSEFRSGLDHVGFAVDSRAELEAWRVRIEERSIDHSPIADRPYGSVLVFRDPDNIQLELYAPPGPS